MTIIILDIVESQFEEIREYYTNEGYENYGLKLRQKIMKKIQRLSDMPRIGRLDPQLSEEFEYRFLLEGRYRIYYEVDDKNALVLISYLFDTRQHPDKLLQDFPNKES